MLSQYLSGVSPISPGYTKFSVKPQPADISRFTTLVPSVAGNIKVSWNNQAKSATLEVNVPKGTEAVATMPKGSYQYILLNNKKVWTSQDNISGQEFKLPSGTWVIKGVKI